MAEKNILLIDSDAELCGILGERLKEFGADIFLAETGNDGFKIARQIKPHVIVMELALPDISGFYVLQKIRATENTFLIPCVVLTHRPEADLESRVMKCGATAFVRKPYNVKTFIPLLQKLSAGPVDQEEAKKAWTSVKPSPAYRLVTERLEVEIRTEHYLMRGLSSGINENGMGAHMNILEKNGDTPPPLSPGQACTISFRSIKYPLLPCAGVVLRLEESWDRRYRQFIAIKFPEEEKGGMMNSDRQSLREWIRGQMK